MHSIQETSQPHKHMHCDIHRNGSVAPACTHLPQVSAAAVELLEAVAAAAGRTLEALLLRSPSTRVVLEYVGRHVADKPALLAELAALLKQPEQELTKAVVPHVIGWMCRNQRREGLAVLARKMGMSVASLVINHAGRAIAEAFWFSYQVRCAAAVL